MFFYLPPSRNKIAPSGNNEKGQYMSFEPPSHLPEHPSAGIGTFFSLQLQRSTFNLGWF
jgi:hypothetical protein